MSRTGKKLRDVTKQTLKFEQIKKIVTKSGLWLIFAALVIIASILSPKFLTYNMFLTFCGRFPFGRVGGRHDVCYHFRRH
jgi:hypothetical protein